MAKSADAFRTISEVAEWLEVPAHVLRFWESKFTQVKPVKRAGGRRYYRPADMRLLGGIKALLHDQGMTIKGVQKLLREEGMQHVAALSQPLDGTGDQTFDIAKQAADAPARVLPFERPGDAPEEDVPEGHTPEEDAPEEKHPADAPPPLPNPAQSDGARPAARTVEPAPPAPVTGSEDRGEEADTAGSGAEQGFAADTASEAGMEADTAAGSEAQPEVPPEDAPSPLPEDTGPDNIFAEDAEDRPAVSAEEVSAPAAPSLPPLPDLPEDPADSVTAPSGALGTLASLRRPVSGDLAVELARLATRLRRRDMRKAANSGPET